MIQMLPDAFVEQMRRQLGDELPVFLQSYDQPATRGLRLNPLKTTVVPENDWLAPIPWEPYGHTITPASRLGADPLHEAGAFYLQEPSAMLPAAILDAKPGEYVLDLCAAPGGKSTQLAGRMAGEGLLVCNEPVAKRAQILSRNLERMGVTNALCISAYPEQLAQRWPDAFDAVLVDAPCSGEGMFRRHPETRSEWTAASPAGCAQRQSEILDAAAIMLRPGGRMVYSTCTMNQIENEGVIEAFLQRHPDFHTAAFSLPGAEAPNGMLTCYPHRMVGEGQFATLLIRDGNATAALPDFAVKQAKIPKELTGALKQFFPDAPSPTGMLGETAFVLADCPDLNGLRVLRAGLHLGHMKGKIFEPDHAWAVSACPPQMRRYELDRNQAARYQAGETIPAELNGWMLPCYGGLPIGWGKASGGIIKNHYPKGLRRPVNVAVTEDETP